MTWVIASASAPSEPAAAGSQWSANFVCPAKSGETTTTFCPLYRASVMKWASGVRVCGMLEPQRITYPAFHQSADSGTSV